MNREPQPPITSVKIGTLEERLHVSAKVPLESALRALAKQAGQPTHECPWGAAGDMGVAMVLPDGLEPKLCLGKEAELPMLDAVELGGWLGWRPWLHGGEHEAWFVDELRLAVKVTLPGKYGAEDLGLPGYARRLAWSNELFGDDVRLLGRVQISGEAGPRVVTTQPWCCADGDAVASPHPTQGEIDLYMRECGFQKAYDGAYLHECRDIVASDALPKNFIRDAAGYIHAVDVILIEPSARQYDRLQAMVASQR